MLGRNSNLQTPRNHLDSQLSALCSPPPPVPPLPCSSNNSFSGTIPPGWLPPGLAVFNATRNRLSLPPDGSLPLFAGGKASSAVVHLSDNPLNAPVPPNLGNLEGVVWLDMTRCNLSGTLPAAPLPPSLELLNLENNSIGGSIPWQQWSASGVKSLLLASNRLTGTLPTSLPDSQLIDLSHNALSGTLPAELLPHLPSITFSVAHNQLTGQIPNASLHLAKPLVWLLLSDNELTGTLPADSSLLTLRWVDLANNRLTGEGGEGTLLVRELACSSLAWERQQAGVHNLCLAVAGLQCTVPSTHVLAGTLPAVTAAAASGALGARTVVVLPQHGAGFCEEVGGLGWNA